MTDHSMQTGTDTTGERWPKWAAIDEEDVLVTEEEVLFGVSSVLEHFITRSDKLPSIAPTPFDGFPMLSDHSVHAFLNHILRNGLCSKVCALVATRCICVPCAGAPAQCHWGLLAEPVPPEEREPSSRFPLHLLNRRSGLLG